MLGSGAHGKIGAYEIRLRTDMGAECYKHRARKLIANRSGDPGAQILREEFLEWHTDDWSKGEGLEFITDYQSQRSTYWKGLGNPRNRGKLVSPPQKNGGASVTTTANATPNKIVFADASGNLYMGTGNAPSAGGANHVFSSSDALSWSSVNVGFTTGEVLTAMASDGSNLWVAAHDGTNAKIQVRDTVAGSNTTFSAAVSSAKLQGIALLPTAQGALLYSWTGKKLREYDATLSSGATGSAKYSAFNETLPTNYHADIVEAGHVVAFFYSAQGHSRVWVYGLSTQGAARPFWRGPRGFVITQMCFSLGHLVFAGDYNGKKAMYAKPVEGGQDFFLGYVRPTSSLNVADVQGGFGDEILVASTQGNFFSYSLEGDSVSEIDDLSATGGTFAGCTTHKDFRLYAKYNSTTVTTYAYAPDDGTLNTSVNTAVESAAWHFDLPGTTKVLLGFSVDASASGVTIGYQADESGSYTSLSATTSAMQYVALGTPTNFNYLRYKVNNGGKQVYSVVPRALIGSYIEEWDLIIDLREGFIPSTQSDAIPTDPSTFGKALFKLFEAKAVVTYLDAYRFKQQADSAWDGATLLDVPTKGYRSYSAMLVEPEESMEDALANGFLRVRLRSVTY